MASSSLPSSSLRIRLDLINNTIVHSDEHPSGMNSEEKTEKMAAEGEKQATQTDTTGQTKNAAATAEISPTPHKSVINSTTAAASSTTTATQKVTEEDAQWSNSSKNLPSLLPHVATKLENGSLSFPINEECTSLKLTPSGSHLVAGFTDGTLRLFDLTGTWAGASSEDGSDSFSEEEEEEEEDISAAAAASSSRAIVDSKSCQRFGAVACQIQARGVHTQLQMQVDISEDGRFAFGGVTRGSMELVAVDLTAVEQQNLQSTTTSSYSDKRNILDYVQVSRHSDAKLKGFGSCTRLRGSTDMDPTYLLLTGRGIKNLHIWSFSPTANDKQEQWQCLYDTPTNGNTISLLHLRYDPHGCLQAMSKSDDQKLRLWDLSYEQPDKKQHEKSVIAHFRKHSRPEVHRPKRPPYVDVASTESTLGIAGAFAFGGGHGMYNQTSVVGLDVDNVRSPYNHTELALPGNIQNRRQQRGDLKSIVRVAGMVMDAGHVLLELSDGSIVQYSQSSTKSNSLPRLQLLPSDTFGEEYRPDDYLMNRTIGVARVASSGTVVAAAATYRNGRGSIVLRQLEQGGAPLKDFWGFNGASTAPVRKILASKSPAGADKGAIVSCMQPASSSKAQITDGSGENRVVQLFPAGGSLVTPRVASGVATSAKVGSILKEPSKASRVSMSPAGAVGPEVSPEQVVTASEMKRQDDKMAKKKSSVMLKYLREAGSKVDDNKQVKAAKATEKQKKRRISSPAVPRKRPSLRDDHRARKSPVATSTHNVAKSMSEYQRNFQSPMRLTRAMRKEAGIDDSVPVYMSVHVGRKLPPPLTSHLPKSTVQQRIPAPVSCENGNMHATQEDCRIKLAANHRAQHEMLRRRVLAGADEVIRSLTRLPSISEAQARKRLTETIDSYRQVLEDMLGRQRLEASALAAQQSSMMGSEVGTLQISFPFQEVFEIARNALEQFIVGA